MTQFIAVAATTNRVLYGVGRPDPEGFSGAPDLRPFPRDGTIFYAWQAPLSFDPPSSTSVLEWHDAPVWVEPASLEAAKEIAWGRVKAERDAAEAAPYEFEGGFYDPNKENISGAALAALLAQLAGQEVADEWTLADNSRRTLSGAQIINLGLTLTQRVKTIHALGRELRDRINAAETAEEAYAVKWPTEETNVEPVETAV